MPMERMSTKLKLLAVANLRPDIILEVKTGSSMLFVNI